MAYARNLVYNNKSLSSIDSSLIIVTFASAGGSYEESEVVNRSVLASPITYDDVIAYDYGAVDNSVYKFSITIARDDGDPLQPSTIRALESWLLSPNEPKWLEFEKGDCVGDAVYDDVVYKGRFVRAAYEESPGYRKYAITFNFENISPYGFTKQYAWELDSTVEAGTATISAPGTDVGKLVNPVVLIQSNSSGQNNLIDHESGTQYIDAEDTEALNLEYNDEAEGQTITIQNLDANTAPFIIKIPQGTTVALIGDNCYYYNGDATFNTSNMELYSFSNLQNFNWPRMVSGTNRIRCSGDAKITFVARFYEALGV